VFNPGCEVTGLIRRPKIVAAVIAVAGIVLFTYALLTPQHTDQTNEHMGMPGTHSSYGLGQVALMLIAAIIIATGLIFVLVREEYEPIPIYSQGELRMDPQVPGTPPAIETPGVDAVPAARGEREGRHDYLVLRLLTGDERAMFKAIMDSGGEALQKDLILRTRMSNAKVSRLLDRLQQKDVISKERYGATNMIKISRKD
jgi:uncharacterized membrane protein